MRSRCCNFGTISDHENSAEKREKCCMRMFSSTLFRVPVHFCALPHTEWQLNIHLELQWNEKYIKPKSMWTRENIRVAWNTSAPVTIWQFDDNWYCTATGNVLREWDEVCVQFRKKTKCLKDWTIEWLKTHSIYNLNFSNHSVCVCALYVTGLILFSRSFSTFHFKWIELNWVSIWKEKGPPFIGSGRRPSAEKKIAKSETVFSRLFT